MFQFRFLNSIRCSFENSVSYFNMHVQYACSVSMKSILQYACLESLRCAHPEHPSHRAFILVPVHGSYSGLHFLSIPHVINHLDLPLHLSIIHSAVAFNPYLKTINREKNLRIRVNFCATMAFSRLMYK